MFSLNSVRLTEKPVLRTQVNIKFPPGKQNYTIYNYYGKMQNLMPVNVRTSRINVVVKIHLNRIRVLPSLGVPVQMLKSLTGNSSHELLMWLEVGRSLNFWQNVM